MYRLVGLVLKTSTSRAEDPKFDSLLRRGNFSALRHTNDLKIGKLPSQALGVIGSAQELVGSVSGYCDWVRWKILSATSILVWQHVNLSEQIRPRDTLA